MQVDYADLKIKIALTGSSLAERTFDLRLRPGQPGFNAVNQAIRYLEKMELTDTDLILHYKNGDVWLVPRTQVVKVHPVLPKCQECGAPLPFPVDKKRKYCNQCQK